MHLLYGGMWAIMEDSCGGDNRHVGDSPAHPDILYPVQLQLHCVSTTHSGAEKVISEITAGIHSLCFATFLNIHWFCILKTCSAVFSPARYPTSVCFFSERILFINTPYFPYNWLGTWRAVQACPAPPSLRWTSCPARWAPTWEPLSFLKRTRRRRRKRDTRWCQRTCAALNTHLVTAWITLMAQVWFFLACGNLTEVVAFHVNRQKGHGRQEDGKPADNWLRHNIASAAQDSLKFGRCGCRCM